MRQKQRKPEPEMRRDEGFRCKGQSAELVEKLAQIVLVLKLVSMRCVRGLLLHVTIGVRVPVHFKNSVRREDILDRMSYIISNSDPIKFTNRKPPSIRICSSIK